MLPFTIAHYRRMFGNPDIIIHDNFSTDNTVKIAESEGCYVVPFHTEGMNDTVQSEIKSIAANEAVSDWVLCIDCDEECLINSDDLDELDAKGVNIVQFNGWNIFDKVGSPWEVKKPMGTQSVGYDKPILIRTGVFDNIQFAAGAHKLLIAQPKEGKQAIWSIGEYKLLHYKHWSCDWNVKRSAELGARQSTSNKEKNHSFHFGFSKEQHENYFNSSYSQREPIIDKRIN